MIISGDNQVESMTAVKGMKTVDPKVAPWRSTDGEMLTRKGRSTPGYQRRDDDFDDIQRLCEIEGREHEEYDKICKAQDESISPLKWSPVTPSRKAGLNSRDHLDSLVVALGNHQHYDPALDMEAFGRAERGGFHPVVSHDANADDDGDLAFTESMQDISSFRTDIYHMSEVFSMQENNSIFRDHADHLQRFEGGNDLHEDHMAFGVPNFHTDRQLIAFDEDPTEPSPQIPHDSLRASVQPSAASSNPRIIQTPLGPALLLTPPAHASSARGASSANSISPLRKFQRWSDEEDAILRYAVTSEDEARPNWKKVSSSFFSNTRSPLQCKSRWQKSLKPGIQIGSWQEYEDDRILHLRNEGFKWSQIADQLPGRVGEHVRDRFVNFLDPDLKKSPWTKQEDKILFEQQRLQGNKWTSIAKLLPGRSENAVKNRWHNAKMTQRRRMRKHAAERSLMAQSMRARQHAAKPGSEEESWNGDEEATSI